jgi:tetratricopeptide (TPR) repeat protein
LEYLREALKVLDPEINPLETANAIAMEGRFHHLAGRHEKASELLQRAADLVAPTASGETLDSFAASTISNIYGYIAGANQHRGRFADADVWARRAIDFGVAHNVLFAQALGFEFLAEDAANAGNWFDGIRYAEQEREIAERLHSRERLAWTQFAAGMNAQGAGDLERSERELLDGIALAETIGELRLRVLCKGNLSVVKATKAVHADGLVASVDQTQMDEALALALENLDQADALGLLYTRAEALRCLAIVRLKQGEIEEAERLCEKATELVGDSESRVSRLWLGPVFLEMLIGSGKLEQAKQYLRGYQELVGECQSPRFTSEANRFAQLLAAPNVQQT